MRYYLQAMGDTCYDPDYGLTYPYKAPVDFRELLTNVGASNIRTAHQFGWSNQPRVLTFNLGGDAKTADLRIGLNFPALRIANHWRHDGS